MGLCTGSAHMLVKVGLKDINNVQFDPYFVIFAMLKISF